MKILVTGGYGLIGHNVVQRLMAKGHTTAIVDNKTNYGIIPQAEVDYLMTERAKKIKDHPCYSADICNEDPLDYIVRINHPDVIVHMASFPRQKVVNANPAFGSRVMSEGLINLLEVSNNYDVRKFVYTSSSMVYGDFENDVDEDAALRLDLADHRVPPDRCHASPGRRHHHGAHRSPLRHLVLQCGGRW